MTFKASCNNVGAILGLTVHLLTRLLNVHVLIIDINVSDDRWSDEESVKPKYI